MIPLTLRDLALLTPKDIVDPIPTTANLYWYANANHQIFQSNGGAASGNGDPVGFITTRGSSGINAEQLTAEAKPTASTINSLPSLSYDGGDFYQVGANTNWNFLHNTSGFTAVIVFRKTVSDPGTAQLMIDTVGVSSANTGLSILYEDRALIPANDRLRVFIGSSSGAGAVQDRQSADGVLPGTTPHIVAVRFNGISTLNARVDGVEVMNFTTNSFSSPTTGNSTAALNVGRRGPFNDFYANGQMPLAALYNRTLSDTEVSNIETYWKTAYGIA